MDITQPHALAFLFAGQGNPTIGMGSDLWDHSDETKRIWDCASDISGTDIRRVCLKGPMNKLVQTTNQQVAVTAINATLYTLCQPALAEQPVLGACGHSVGEYAALYAANAVTLETLFRMIHFRASLMDQLSKTHKGLMQAVKGIDYATMSALIAETDSEVDISCDNSTRQQVIGGTPAALRDFTEVLMARGYESTKLGVSGAWHTRLMADGVQPMRDFLAGIDVKTPEFAVLMNVTGAPVASPDAIKENLALHLTHTVKWTAAMQHLLASQAPLSFIEISKKAYLAHMLNDFDGYSPAMARHCRTL